MNDLIEILKDTNLSIPEILEMLNDILNNSDSKEELDDYARKNTICPNCYCDEFFVEKCVENDDADGNRGMKVDVYTCKNCGEDLY